jgi:hypothetical protein
MIDFNEFEEVIKPINKNKYHICRTLEFTEDGIPYLSEWSIFRKDMSIAEYFDKNNLAVLSSVKGNTLEDIKKFMEENKNEEQGKY